MQALSQTDEIAPELYKIAKTAEAKGGYLKWNRVANGATRNRAFATTANGYYVLGPKVMDPGDIICFLFGGKMPFCLRPWGNHFLLMGECYVHGLMDGEAVELLKTGDVAEEVFHIM